MNVYLYDEKTRGALAQLCKSYGIEVTTHEDIARRRVATAQAPSFFLNDVDALIIEMTEPTPDIQFVLAQALLTQKPTLCLYAKNFPPRELLSFIKQQPHPRTMKTFSYISQTLPPVLHRFIKMHSGNAVDQENIPSLKYTLRLTPRADKYLQWKAMREGKTKATMLRALVTKQAQEDTEYRTVMALFDDE